MKIGSTPCSKAPATSNARTELRVMVRYTYTLKDAEGHLQKSRVSLLLKHLAVLDSCMPTLTVPRSWWDLAQGSKPSPTADLRSVLDFQFAMGTWFQSIWSAKRGVPSSDMQKICKRLKLGKPSPAEVWKHRTQIAGAKPLDWLCLVQSDWSEQLKALILLEISVVRQFVFFSLLLSAIFHDLPCTQKHCILRTWRAWATS